MRRLVRAATVCLAATAGLAAGAVAQESEDAETTFAVLGHVRGERSHIPNSRLDEALAEIREASPEFLILAGDNIWGDSDARGRASDGEWVLQQWTHLDSVVAELGIPVFRVPGNHDISDSVTLSIYEERYGSLPAAVDVGRTRLILLTTTWDDDRPDRQRGVRGFAYHLDAAQIEFLRDRLAEHEDYDQAFVVMHHLLWLEQDDSPWWTEVHPILAEAGVTAVLTGDYGPTKFSHTSRDGVEYYQTALAGDPGVQMRRAHEWNRLLARQFDNYLVVRTGGGAAAVEVGTVGEISSGHFTREMWWDVHGSIIRPGQQLSGRDHLGGLWAIPRARLVVIAFLVGPALFGLIVGWLLRRRLC